MRQLPWIVLAVFLSTMIEAQPVDRGLIVDLDADRGIVADDDDRVSAWTNQVDTFPAQNFVQQDEGRPVPGSGRPTLRRSIAELNGHNALIFKRQELVNHDEDAFDHLITGSGYTWFAVLSVYPQIEQLKDVNSFFGNLRNGGNYEGIWGNLTDDNRVWIGSRNGLTFGRWDENNPPVVAPLRLAEDQFYVVAGRMGAGSGTVQVELFVKGAEAVAARPFPVNPNANSSKLVIGQERDATNHPGQESFDGELARFLLYERPLTDDELILVMTFLADRYTLR